MKRTLLIIALVSIVTCQVISNSDSCTCAQLLTQADCGRNTQCTWNLTKLACELPQNTGTSTVTKNYGKSLYCEGLVQNDCLEKQECAWVENKCTFFTSCTPFEKATKDDCQAISKRCITDGQICVEIDLCSTYLTSTSCVQSKTNYCVWDETGKKCSDVTECGQLPTTLTTDADCRKQLKNECTAKVGGGCVESGTNCADQVAEIGCVKNKARTVDCFWGNGQCYDKKCENALTINKTHVDCQTFLPKCTAKEGGGCVDLKTCTDGKISEGCKIDSLGNECYWSAAENKCKDKVCASAPNTLKTNSDCQKQFSAKCITNGTGCVEDTSCGSSIVQDQCAVNRYNNRSCTWNGTCKDLTCDNAGAEYSGHESCSKYSSLCTGKTNNATGCQNRTCENAPTTITSNGACESYLPTKNCITKKDGGCVTNTTCSAILIKDACVTDVNGKDCYWDTVGNACLDKTCATLPARFNTHTACNGEIATCTVNSSGTCVDLLCENIIDKNNCANDKDKKECVYYGSCYQKQCSAAPQTNLTHADCQSYLKSCTLSNTKKGCMDLPITCSALIKDNCELKANGSKCGWTGSSCVDYICTTAPIRSDADYTVSLCETYKPKSNCVPNQQLTSCVELPVSCDSRKIKIQCEVAGTTTNGNKTCLWDSTNEKCYEKTCANATHEGNASSVTVTDGKVAHNDCQAWLKDKDGNSLCIVGTLNNVCANYPTTCNGLGENSCDDNVLKVANSNPTQYLNCYWNATSGKCVDGNVCANIDKTTHSGCSSVSNNKCTVSADETKCVDRTACNSYSKKVQCEKDKNDATCKWDGTESDTNKCIDLPCLDDLEDTKNYLSHDICTSKSNLCTLTNLPCGLKKANCGDYITSAACVGGKLGDKAQCSWDTTANSGAGGCVDVASGSFACSNVKGANLTGGYCNSVNAKCSVNSAGTACIDGKNSCNGYTATGNCKWALVDGICIWSTTCRAAKCSELSGTNDAECKSQKSNCVFGASGKCKPDCASKTGTLTIDDCQNFDAECAVKNDGSACYYIDKTCTNLSADTCTKGTDGYCYKSGSTCAKTVVTSCGSITTTSNGAALLTGKYCAGISNTACTALINGSACDTIQNQCSDYSTGSSNLDKCYYAKEGLCILDTTCKKYDFATNGCTFKTGGGSFSHTTSICQQFNPSCVVASTPANGCQDATPVVSTPACADYKGTYNFPNCFHYSKICSVNKAGSACINKQDLCTNYTEENCAYAITEGPCSWNKDTSKCVQVSCDNLTFTSAELAAITADVCSTKQQNCTVRTGGCQKRTACSSYTKENQCKKNLSDQDCIWNTDTKKCADKTCSNADSTKNTHTKCQGVATTCTVKLGDDGTTLAGCITLQDCQSYKVKDQCYLNSANKACEWSLAETPNKCVDKTCTSADPSTNTDFDKCQAYLTDKSCTLASKKGDDGNYTDGGCMLLALCSEYYTQAQCKKSKLKDDAGILKDCYWNDTSKKCADAACTQADDSYTTHESCVAYGKKFNTVLKCTVDKDDKGCVDLPNQCEGMTKGQCQDVDSNDVRCIWLETSGVGSCATRTCENAVSPGSSSDCSTHLFYCTMIDSGNKCKTKTCEDYNLSDDTSCAALFNKSGKCTTNGKFCVNRGSCAQAQSQKGCTKDISGTLCDWIVPTVATQSPYCVIKSCNTAPKDYNTESQCLQYFTPPNNGPTCTTQSGGGCVQRSSCSAAKVQAACTTDSSGNICAWDSDTSNCRNQECKDISGSTHSACQNPSDKSFKGKCTAGKSGKCADKQTCLLTTVEAACVVGTDGPCIWLPDYVKTDSTKGACFPYDSCRSLGFGSDQLCKYISDKCTTDSKKCIGITSCAKTNVDGGCVTGTDGACITTVQTLGSANKVCTKYVSCTSALFTTHSDCYSANSKCTTNGTTSCVELGACSSYPVKDACRYTKDGVQTNANKQVTQTGYCTWDDTTNSCRDQNCADLKGTNHYTCSSQLSTCTTDGTTCITKDACAKYTINTQCTSAQGTEGLCQWVDGTNGAVGTCRVKTCDDITGGTNPIACSIVNNCTTDGTKCISRVTCDKYTTKAGCNTQGTDGICVWSETTTGTGTGAVTTGKCSLMNNCAAAAKDQNACQSASSRCKWTSATATVASSCVDHTCESYNAQNGRCSYFPTWDQNKLNICKNVNGKCTASDPKTLLETECYIQSAYMYSWNSKTNTCAQCGSVIVTPNNSSNGNDTNNNTNGSTSTDSGYVLGVAVLLGYLMF